MHPQTKLIGELPDGSLRAIAVNSDGSLLTNSGDQNGPVDSSSIGNQSDLLANINLLGDEYDPGEPYSLISLFKTLVRKSARLDLLTNLNTVLSLTQQIRDIVSVPIITKPSNSSVIDRSGAIATGNTNQSIMPFNNSRSYLLIQNNSTGDLWIDFGVAAFSDSPSIKIAAGETFVMEGGAIANNEVYILGATIGQKYTAKEI